MRVSQFKNEDRLEVVDLENPQAYQVGVTDEECHDRDDTNHRSQEAANTELESEPNLNRRLNYCQL